jgi:hypothetical protein
VFIIIIVPLVPNTTKNNTPTKTQKEYTKHTVKNKTI